MIAKILKLLVNLLPSAVEFINSRQENQKMDNILEFVKAIENRIDKIQINVSNQLKTIFLWIRIIFIIQLIILLFLIILIFKL